MFDQYIPALSATLEYSKPAATHNDEVPCEQVLDPHLEYQACYSCVNRSSHGGNHV
jgi:hypothetical protein